jgi:phosphate-selective porin OprO/OprP
MVRRTVCVFVLASVVVTGMAAAQDADPDVRLRFPPPSLRVGDVFRLDFRVRLQWELREFDPPSIFAGDEFELRRSRVGIEGHLFQDLEYEVDAELQDDEQPWRDAFVNYRRFRAAEIQAGRFKIPFGREQTTSIFNIDFAQRALASTELTSGREVGGMLHGRFGGDVLLYETGVFKHDGDYVAREGVQAGTTWVGRVVVGPWANGRSVLRRAELGVAATIGELPEGLNGLRGRTLSGYEFWAPVYVKGRRVRLGVEGGWTPGPVSVQGEYIRVSDERNGQGLGDVDLPDAVAHGWYLGGSWALTGERKAGGIEPRRPFLQGGAGAVEVAGRFETLRFGSAGTDGEPPFSNPRAANLLPNRDRILTIGVNWYLNRFGRITVNGMREWIQDPERSPELGLTRFSSYVVRLQFVL